MAARPLFVVGAAFQKGSAFAVKKLTEIGPDKLKDIPAVG
jgi:hypothetical protein